MSEKNNENNLTQLSDYDIVELYVRCVAIFVERCSKYDLSADTSFTLGKKLWGESIKILEEYRKDNPIRPQAIGREPFSPSKR